MKHAAVLLIVGTLAGTPVVDLACVSICDQDTTAHPFGCHHDMTAAAAAVINNADDSCARLFVFTPYVREEVQRPAAVMPASAPYAVAFGSGEAQLATTHRIDSPPPEVQPMPVLRL